MLLDPCPGTPGWATLNARFRLQPWEMLRIDATLANLTDARYKTHGSGLYAPGFDAVLTATVFF
jgi:hypothetical protein